MFITRAVGLMLPNYPGAEFVGTAFDVRVGKGTDSLVMVSNTYVVVLQRTLKK